MDRGVQSYRGTAHRYGGIILFHFFFEKGRESSAERFCCGNCELGAYTADDEYICNGRCGQFGEQDDRCHGSSRNGRKQARGLVCGMGRRRSRRRRVAVCDGDAGFGRQHECDRDLQAGVYGYDPRNSDDEGKRVSGELYSNVRRYPYGYHRQRRGISR